MFWFCFYVLVLAAEAEAPRGLPGFLAPDRRRGKPWGPKGAESPSSLPVLSLWLGGGLAVWGGMQEMIQQRDKLRWLAPATPCKHHRPPCTLTHRKPSALNPPLHDQRGQKNATVVISISFIVLFSLLSVSLFKKGETHNVGSVTSFPWERDV